jgi:hypothetical protein
MALAPDRKVAGTLGVHPKTLTRWDEREEVGFPKAIWLNGRRYRDLDEVEKWVRKSAVASASKSDVEAA